MSRRPTSSSQTAVTRRARPAAATAHAAHAPPPVRPAASGGAMRRALATLPLAVALVIAGPAGADTMMVHTVKPGDTLPLLAAEYYGDRDHQIFFMVANGLQHPRSLIPGEKLKVPASQEVTADVGDTLESLAQANLGDRRRARFLAEFNALTADDTLAAGQVLSIPVLVRHTAAGKERLADIAAAYFGSADAATLLRQYNFLDRDALAAGETLVVPIHHVRVRSSRLPPPDAAAQRRAAKRVQTTKQADEALPVARAAWRRAAFSEVKRLLTGVDADFLDTAPATEVGLLLGCAYVATGDLDTALATFRRVLERAPQHRLDAYGYSPKLRAAWQAAGGQVTE